MLSEPELKEGAEIWSESRRLSADDISAEADLMRLQQQRDLLRAANWQALARNYEHSVFYQLTLTMPHATLPSSTFLSRMR